VVPVTTREWTCKKQKSLYLRKENLRIIINISAVAAAAAAAAAADDDDDDDEDNDNDDDKNYHLRMTKLNFNTNKCEHLLYFQNKIFRGRISVYMVNVFFISTECMGGRHVLVNIDSVSLFGYRIYFR
jgi:hypothetical protein